MLYFKGINIRDGDNFPNVDKWFKDMETLSSYRLTKSDYYTHAWDLPPQLGGCVLTDRGRKFAAAIDGESTWQLPPTPDNQGLEPDWTWIKPGEARREAAERLLHNHSGVAKFACRGSRSGFPPVSAPLADPNASSDEALVPVIDMALASIAQRLCSQDVSSCKEADEIMSKVKEATAESKKSEEVKQALAYLRDRVGVPRDMSLPAARWLRGSLNQVISQLP